MLASPAHHPKIIIFHNYQDEEGKKERKTKQQIPWQSSLPWQSPPQYLPPCKMIVLEDHRTSHPTPPIHYKQEQTH